MQSCANSRKIGLTMTPYQDLTRDEFFALKQPVIDWSKLSDFEKTDETIGAQALACTAGGCEL